MISSIATTGAPAAIGPYSQGVIAGDLIFCSGQTPLVPATGEIVGDAVDAQAAQCLANLQAVLAAEGLGLAQIVKTTVFLTDMADFATVNQVYADSFAAAGTTVLPARSTVQVAALPKGARVEIEAIAVRPPAA